jgi:hypothetical protein
MISIMAMTFDATLKDMGRESPVGFLATFDQPPVVPVRLLNAAPDRARKLVTDAYLLTGLRLRRDAAARIFRGVRAMHESDTFLAILDEGQEKATRDDILVVGEERLGAPGESIRNQLANITDLTRLKRMIRRAAKAASWQEILDTP